MFPFARSLPEARLVYIKCFSGVCVLVVWAHKVMGLTVIVTTQEGTHLKTTMFGRGGPKVIIEDHASSPGMRHMAPSITMLQIPDKEELFVFKSEVDEHEMQGDLKHPLEGYGSFLLQWHSGNAKNRRNVLRLFEILCTSMAILICRDLDQVSRANLLLDQPRESGSISDMSLPDPVYVDPRAQQSGDDRREHIDASSPAFGERQHNKRGGGDFGRTDEDRIIAAAESLFIRNLNRSHIQDYLRKYAETPYNYMLLPESEIEKQLFVDFDHDRGRAERYFGEFIPILRYLSILILATAHIIDLKAAAKLPLSCSIERLSSHLLADELHAWKASGLQALGHSLQWAEDAWLQVFALLTVGSEREYDMKATALVSSRGWSVYSISLAGSDPGYIGQSEIVVQRGVPCRGTVCKHYLWMVQSTLRNHRSKFSVMLEV